MDVLEHLRKLPTNHDGLPSSALREWKKMVTEYRHHRTMRESSLDKLRDRLRGWLELWGS